MATITYETTQAEIAAEKAAIAAATLASAGIDPLKLNADALRDKAVAAQGAYEEAQRQAQQKAFHLAEIIDRRAKIQRRLNVSEVIAADTTKLAGVEQQIAQLAGADDPHSRQAWNSAVLLKHQLGLAAQQAALDAASFKEQLAAAEDEIQRYRASNKI